MSWPIPINTQAAPQIIPGQGSRQDPQQGQMGQRSVTSLGSGSSQPDPDAAHLHYIGQNVLLSAKQAQETNKALTTYIQTNNNFGHSITVWPAHITQVENYISRVPLKPHVELVDKACSNLNASNLEDLVAKSGQIIQDLSRFCHDNSSLSEKVETLETEKSSLSEKVETLETEKSFLNGKVETLETEKSFLSGKVDTLEKTSLNLRLNASEAENMTHIQTIETLKCELKRQTGLSDSSFTSYTSILSDKTESDQKYIDAVNNFDILKQEFESYIKQQEQEKAELQQRASAAIKTAHKLGVTSSTSSDSSGEKGMESIIINALWYHKKGVSIDTQVDTVGTIGPNLSPTSRPKWVRRAPGKYDSTASKTSRPKRVRRAPEKYDSTASKTSRPKRVRRAPEKYDSTASKTSRPKRVRRAPEKYDSTASDTSPAKKKTRTN